MNKQYLESAKVEEACFGFVKVNGELIRKKDLEYAKNVVGIEESTEELAELAE